METGILTAVIFSPLVGALLIMVLRRDDEAGIRMGAFIVSLVTLALTILAVVLYYRSALTPDGLSPGFALKCVVPWIGGAAGRGFEISYRVGVDGISIWMLALTALLTPLAIASSFSSIRHRTKEYYVLLLVLEVGVLGVFCAMDLIVFYVFFEFTLIPLFFLIAIWGGPERRRAANKFFIYTLAGSVLTFAGIVYISFYTLEAHGVVTFEIARLVKLGQEGLIPLHAQWWLFLAFAAGFAIKVPLFPFHTWLPLAHTEAPTAGSVILAGVLLKLGTYGFCRLSIPILPDASRQLAPVIAVIAIIGIIYTALAAWVQRDVKKLIAYSSVSHLGFCMLGLFSLRVAGVSGGVLYMVNHGLSTGALFLVIGFMYERYHTRDVDQVGGLAKRMPWLAFFLIFFTLSSIGLPGLNGFVGEFLVLFGTATSQSTADGFKPGPLGFGYAIPAALGIILSALYMLWMCQRLLFGPLKEPPNTPDTSAGLTADLTGREKWILVPIALCCLFLGVYPKPLLWSFNQAVEQNILEAEVSFVELPADDGDVLVESPKLNPSGGVAKSRRVGTARLSQPQHADPHHLSNEALVLRHASIYGYSRSNLMRASLLVNCQSTPIGRTAVARDFSPWNLRSSFLFSPGGRTIAPCALRASQFREQTDQGLKSLATHMRPPGENHSPAPQQAGNVSRRFDDSAGWHPDTRHIRVPPIKRSTSQLPTRRIKIDGAIALAAGDAAP